MDSVIREKPQAIKRNRDYIFALNEKQLRYLVKGYTITVLLDEDPEEKTWVAVPEGFDLVGYGKNKDDAIQDLVTQLRDYAYDYFLDFETMFAAPNRRDHFPYVLNLMLHDSQQQIGNMLECQVGMI